MPTPIENLTQNVNALTQQTVLQAVADDTTARQQAADKASAINAIVDNADQQALQNFFGGIAGDATAEDLLTGDDGLIDKVSEDLDAIETLNASEPAIRKMLCRREGRDPANFADLDAVAADVSLVQDLSVREATTDIITNSDKAHDAIAANDRATREMMCHPTPFDATSFTDVADAASDSALMTTIASDAQACRAMAAVPLAMQEVTASQTARDQIIPSQTAMNAVAASRPAMEQIAASQTAMQEIINSNTARQTVIPSGVAMRQVAASQLAMQEIISSSTARQETVASPAAMVEIGNSATARAEVYASQTMLSEVIAVDQAIAALSVGEAGGDASEYPDMATVASDESVMQALADSPTAMSGLADSQVALDEIGNSPVVMNTMYNSNIAINAMQSGALVQSESSFINNKQQDVTIKNDRVILFQHNPGASGKRSNQPLFAANDNSFPHTADRIRRNNNTQFGRSSTNTNATFIDISDS